jgi:hypothetical protein
MSTQALVVHPQSRYLSMRSSPDLNGLQLQARAALLGDLADMADTSLAKAFGVLFEAPGMEASGFRSLDGVLGSVSGLCKALCE